MERFESLMAQVNLVKAKYNDLAEYTGENYNVFNILNVTSNELSHSAIIANLLNTKGNHGQKDLFLNLFIREVENLFEEEIKLNDFETAKSFTRKEKHIGNGRIDIFISDGRNNIIIENKINAGDQSEQLIRYKDFDKKAPIFYLTLDGREPSKSSKGNLKLGKDFICISYKEHIKKWLEHCIKEMANKAIIRETLNQYLNLVKNLTNQTSNNNMANEIKDLILKNIEASKLIRDNYDSAITMASLLQIEKLKEIIENKGLICSIERASREGRDGLFVEIKKFEIQNEIYDLGINIELRNDYFFFCVVKQGKNRGDKMNKLEFSVIKEYLHNKIPDLIQVNSWTIGKANDFNVGINRNEYYLPTTDNTERFEELADRIFEFKRDLTNS